MGHVSFLFVNNTINSFDAIMRKNDFVFFKCTFTIHNDLIKVMYNCIDMVNGTMWSS